MNESKAMLELADRLASMPAAEAVRGPKDGATIMAALRASAPQGDGRAVREALDWLVNCVECEVNVPRTTTVFQLRLAKAKEALSAPPSVALEADLTDDQIMEILRRVTKDELYEMLTCKRWKDGIDITGPTYAAERLAKEFRAALTRPQPGGAPLCEICGQRPGKHDAQFEGFACDECKSQWTETVVADDILPQPGGAVAGTERGGGA